MLRKKALNFSFDYIYKEFVIDETQPYVTIMREFDDIAGIYFSYILTKKKFNEIKEKYEEKGFMGEFYQHHLLMQKFEMPKENLR